MRINYNVSAMLSNNALANNDSFLAQSLERLSSGLKINHAKDNPAGLAMAKRMNAQIEGLSVAGQNASDGVSIIETADGALSEVSEMLQRINELAVKASNGTMGNQDLATVQEEIQALKEEITRVSKTTEFNGQKLLDGSFDLKGYTNTQGITVNSYSTDTQAKEYTITNMKVDKTPEGKITVDLSTLQLGPEFPADATKFEVKDNLFTISGGGGFELTLDLNGLDFGTGNSMTFTGNDKVSVDVLGIGAMRLQVGANEGQVLAVNIPTVSLQNMGIEDIDVSSPEGALDALDRIGGAIRYVSSVRGRLGAYQNRLESTVSSLDITSENMTAAYSRIMDVDMAEEMTNFTTYQVLTQSGTSMLAQANERPSQILQLLQ